MTVDDCELNQAPRKSSIRSTILQWILMGFIAVNVVVLYVLHFTHSTPTSDVDAAPQLETAAVFDEVANLAHDTVVGFGENGRLESGAGMSFYFNRANMPSGKMSNLMFSTFRSDAHLMMHQRGGSEGPHTVVTKFKLNRHDVRILIDAPAELATLKNCVPMGLVTLSDSQHLALVRKQGNNEKGYPMYVVPIGGDSQVSFDTSKMKHISQYSHMSMISKLSSNAFVVAYYEYVDGAPVTWEEPRQHVVQVGNIDASGNIDLSHRQTFGGISDMKADRETQFGAAAAISDTEFIVPWYVSKFSQDKYDMRVESGLCLDAFRHTSDGLQSLTSSCTKAHQPAFYLQSVRFTDRSIAVVFYDSANSFALTLLTAELTKYGTIQFRSSIVVDASSGYFDFGVGYHWYLTPQVEYMANGHIAVGYQHAGTNGQANVRIFSVDDSHRLEAVTAPFPISTEEYSITADEKNTMRALSLNLLSSKNDELIVGSIGDLESGQEKQMSVFQIKSNPVGLVSKSGKKTVAMNGLVETEMTLEPGRSYYGTTTGKLVGGPFAGHLQGGQSPTDMVLINQDLLVSHQSKVGVAVGAHTLRMDTQ